MKHANTGKCLACERIIDRYPGLHPKILTWFMALQTRHPEAHLSCAGRGWMDQEAVYRRRVSSAQWGQSAHNYNAAIDLFELADNPSNIYDLNWFKAVVEPNIPDYLEWYGRPGSKFFEYPHVELKAWRELVRTGEITLVENVF